MDSKKEERKPMVIQDSNPRRKPYKQQLQEAVEREDYERAAWIRDTMRAIDQTKRTKN